MRKIILILTFFIALLNHTNAQVTHHLELPPSPPIPDTSNKADLVFTYVEEMPAFPGGENALVKFISDHIIYPEAALKKHYEGRVYVTFIIDKTGKVTEVKLLRGIGEGCDEEAVRVVKSLPDWTIGRQNGLPVKVQYKMPVSFVFKGR